MSLGCVQGTALIFPATVQKACVLLNHSESRPREDCGDHG